MCMHHISPHLAYCFWPYYCCIHYHCVTLNLSFYFNPSYPQQFVESKGKTAKAIYDYQAGKKFNYW